MTARRGFGSLELTLALYVLAYVPNVVLTRLTTRELDAAQVATQGGAEILPASLLFNLVLTVAFIGFAGWHRDAHAFLVGAWRVPRPTWGTLLSGTGSALILCTVPLSFTFTTVSIPFIQLLMKGSILVLAPLVDLIYGRRVRWWSWAALALVILALGVVINDRDGLRVPPLALVTVALYTGGYFLRIVVMTHVAKREDSTSGRGYFVEEKLVAMPLSIVIIALLAGAGPGNPSIQASITVLSDPGSAAFWMMLGIGITLSVVAICATVVLLAPQENSFCVPLERSTSLVGGVIASWLLYWGWGLTAPTGAEMLGAAILVGAILLLTIAPRRESAVTSRVLAVP